MKKLHLIVVALLFLLSPVFSQTNEQEEIAYLLFLPNSSNGFVNRSQAMNQLDSLAENLKTRNLNPGQIHVYGYSAVAANSIEPVHFSLERAIFVISELQKRGVPINLFSEPVGFGEANLWGSNATAATRSPNRRVRIVLDIVPAAVAAVASTDAASSATGAAGTIDEAKTEESSTVQRATVESVTVPPPAPSALSAAPSADSGRKFSWIYLLPLLLLILAIILLLIFLSKRRKKSAGETASPSAPEPAFVAPPVAAVAAPVAAVAAAVIVSDSAEDTLNIKRSKYMELENAIREIVAPIPPGDFVDLHTIVSRLLQTHDDIYFANIGNYQTAGQYHSKISSIVTEMTDVVELVGKSYSRNIHFNFSECNIFRKKK